ARPRRPPGVRAGEPVDQADLPHPRLGYYGVLDERLDLGLLAAMADAHPEWQLVLVGPVAKIDHAALPRRPNLHYFGQRSYGELPAYLAGWDVCLLPFALNDSTRFISPTKTLEYMAAERPIVSTSITDVAEPYSDIVYLGDGPEAFIAAAEAALSQSDEERTRRVARMREVLARTSWDRTARDMERQVTDALARRRPQSQERTSVTHATEA
ncbi:MAG: glycosyltransferase, partial [Gemmatimonadales bacterium]|nr:glycosyltransferase [Gemmatimonadales bacterium]